MGAGKRSNEKAVGKDVKKRKCLNCDKEFLSYSKYNRICLDCKKTPEYTQGMFKDREDQ